MRNLRQLLRLAPILIFHRVRRRRFLAKGRIHDGANAALSYASQLEAAEHGDIVAWVDNVDGVRNIWIARGPAFTPRQLTQYTDDDGRSSLS